MKWPFISNMARMVVASVRKNPKHWSGHRDVFTCKFSLGSIVVNTKEGRISTQTAAHQDNYKLGRIERFYVDMTFWWTITDPIDEKEWAQHKLELEAAQARMTRALMENMLNTGSDADVS